MSTLSFAVSKETEEALAQEVTQVSNIDPKQAYALLKKTYPNSIGQNLPLMIGVHKQVMAEMPALKQATLRAAFRLHVRNPKYLKNMRKGGDRYNLAGKPEGTISEGHRMGAMPRPKPKPQDNSKAAADNTAAAEKISA